MMESFVSRTDRFAAAKVCFMVGISGVDIPLR